MPKRPAVKTRRATAHGAPRAAPVTGTMPIAARNAVNFATYVLDASSAWPPTLETDARTCPTTAPTGINQANERDLPGGIGSPLPWSDLVPPDLVKDGDGMSMTWVQVCKEGKIAYQWITG
jgi:hypothetical protein